MAIYLYQHKVKDTIYLNACYSKRIDNKVKRIVVKRYGALDKLHLKNLTLEDIEKEIKILDAEFKEAREFNSNPIISKDGFNLKFEKEEGDLDYEKVPLYLSLQHVPLRYMWEKLELDKLFAKIKRSYITTKKSTTQKVKARKYNLDTVAFYLVAHRICNPCSKSKTLELKYGNVYDYASTVNEYNIYDCLDVLNENRTKIKKQLDKSVRKVVNRDLTLCLFDVTTLYFDSEKKKSQRKKNAKLPKVSELDNPFSEDSIVLEEGLPGFGMSKDRKYGKTQVVMALVSDANGIPLTYKIFNGATAETKTFIELVDEVINEFNLNSSQITVCADAGLNRIENLAELEQRGIKFIINYPLSNRLKASEKKRVLFTDEEKTFLLASNQANLFKEILIDRSYCFTENNKSTFTWRCLSKLNKKRLKKDLKDVDKLQEKAESNLNKGVSYVETIRKSNQASYYIDLNKATSNIDKEIVINTSLFDNRRAIAGYSNLVTNIPDISAQDAHLRYANLFKIEENFRTFKTNLETRPIYVYKDEHIEGHILMCFIAQVVLKTLLHYLKNRDLTVTHNELIQAINSYSFAVLLGQDTQSENLFFSLNLSEPAKDTYTKLKESMFISILQALDNKVNTEILLKYRYFKESHICNMFNLRQKPSNLVNNCLSYLQQTTK